MAKTYTTKKNAALWGILDGPNTKPVYLGCHKLDTLEAPEGGITLQQCFDRFGNWTVTGYTEDAPEPVKTSIMTDLGNTLAWLEDQNCRFLLWAFLRCDGQADLWSNRERGIGIDVAKFVTRKYENLVGKDEDAIVNVSGDVEGLPPLILAFDMKAQRQVVTETRAFNDIAFCNNANCGGCSGAARKAGQDGFASTDGAGGVTANVDFTDNGGGDGWAAGGADPFAVAENISAIACFYITRTGLRRLVARGTTDAGNPAEIAYSDDDGATWGLVNLSTANAIFVSQAGAFAVVDQAHIWLVTTDGGIHFSENSGITWTLQTSGIATQLNVAAFADAYIGYVAGNTNVIRKTIDGGTTWSAVTGPTAQAAQNIISIGLQDDLGLRIWLGYSNGKTYYSNDGGTTWAERTFTGSGAGTVPAIKFWNEWVGYMIHNTAAPKGDVFQTLNGGYSWEIIDTPTNTGLNALALINERLLFVAGEASGGTGFIAKVSGG